MPECPPSLHAEWYSSSMSSSCTPSCVDSVLARRCAGPGALCAALGARGGRGRRAGGGRGGAGGAVRRVRGLLWRPACGVRSSRRYDPRATRRRDADTRTNLVRNANNRTLTHARSRGRAPRAIIASPRRTPPQSHMIASRTAQPLQFCCSRVRAYEPSIYHRPSTSD